MQLYNPLEAYSICIYTTHVDSVIIHFSHNAAVDIKKIHRAWRVDHGEVCFAFHTPTTILIAGWKRRDYEEQIAMFFHNENVSLLWEPSSNLSCPKGVLRSWYVCSQKNCSLLGRLSPYTFITVCGHLCMCVCMQIKEKKIWIST